jgi:hypothetical protein
MRDGSSQLAVHIPGAKRRGLFTGLGVLGFIGIEVALWFAGKAAGGPTLGGALVLAGIIVAFVLGIVFGVRDDSRRRARGEFD